MVHTGQHFADSDFLKNLTVKGANGVQLFFILSAFTLFNSYEKRFDSDGESRNIFFFIRRVFRIAPLYTISAIFYTLVEVCINGFHSVAYWKVIVNIIYLNGIILPAINYIPPGGWSIGTEMLFYLLIPTLFKLIKTFKGAFYFLLITILLSNIINFADKFLIEKFTNHDYNSLRSWSLYFWLPNQLPVFAFGIFLYKGFTRFGEWNKLSSFFLVLSILLFFILSQFKFSLEYPYYFFQEEYAFSIIFCLFILGIKNFKFEGIFSKLLLKIGQYSFSMYLSHFIVINIFVYYFKSLNLNTGDFYYSIIYILIVSVTFLISSFLFRFEKIGIRYGNNLIKRFQKDNNVSG